MTQLKIIDAHCDTVGLFCLDNSDYDFTTRNPNHHIDLPRLIESGIKLQFFAFISKRNISLLAHLLTACTCLTAITALCSAALMTCRLYTRPWKLLDHFVHVADVAGVDHLGIGADFDGIEQVIDGLEDVTGLPRLVDGLSARLIIQVAAVISCTVLIFRVFLTLFMNDDIL